MHETELIRLAFATHHIFPSTAVTQSMVLGNLAGVLIIFLAMYRGVKMAK